MKKTFYSSANSAKISVISKLIPYKTNKSLYSWQSHLFHNILFILFIMLSIIFSLNNISFAAYPKLINKLISAFEDIKSYIVAIATPIAAVAIRIWLLNAKI